MTQDHPEPAGERDTDEARDAAERDQWLRENVPPHHL
jgi:hypothetical protein